MHSPKITHRPIPRLPQIMDVVHGDIVHPHPRQHQTSHIPQLMEVRGGQLVDQKAIKPTAHITPAKIHAKFSPSEKAAAREGVGNITQRMITRESEIEELRQQATMLENHHRHSPDPVHPQTFREMIAARLALGGAVKAQQLDRKKLGGELVRPLADLHLGQSFVG